MTFEQRRRIRKERDEWMRRRLAAAEAAGLHECPSCGRELEPDEFARAANACRDCEAERLRLYRLRCKGVAA